MFRPFAFLLAAFVAGCSSGSPVKSTEVSQIGVDELARIYRLNPRDRTFHGRLVQCELAPATYRIRKGAVEAGCFEQDRPCCIYFECPATPANNTHRLIVTGRVQGIVRDGIWREASCDYYVLVEFCSVTMLEP